MWSLGCLLVEVISGTILFKADKEQKLMELICKMSGTPTEETWEGVTKLKYYDELIPKELFVNNQR